MLASFSACTCVREIESKFAAAGAASLMLATGKLEGRKERRIKKEEKFLRRLAG